MMCGKTIIEFDILIYTLDKTKTVLENACNLAYKLMAYQDHHKVLKYWDVIIFIG